MYPEAVRIFEVFRERLCFVFTFILYPRNLTIFSNYTFLLTASLNLHISVQNEKWISYLLCKIFFQGHQNWGGKKRFCTSCSVCPRWLKYSEFIVFSQLIIFTEWKYEERKNKGENWKCKRYIVKFENICRKYYEILKTFEVSLFIYM